MSKKVLKWLNYLAVGIGLIALGLLIVGIVRALFVA